MHALADLLVQAGVEQPRGALPAALARYIVGVAPASLGSDGAAEVLKVMPILALVVISVPADAVTEHGCERFQPA